MMLLDLHYKTHWEQHDRQSCSLASTTHQTLDEATWAMPTVIVINQ